MENTETKLVEKINVLVIGQIGAGKTTLIHSGLNAKSQIGPPMNALIRKCETDEFPLCLWDTLGFECGAYEKDQILDEFNAKSNGSKIDAIWYCRNANYMRFSCDEIDIVKDYYSLGIPVIGVMTMCIHEKQFNSEHKEQIHKLFLDNGMDIPIMGVLAQSYFIDLDDQEYEIKAFGVKALVDYTIQVATNRNV